jgi:ketosteroid isomerase-like protein
MSRENVEIVRRVFDAWRCGNYEAALAAYHPEVVYDATVLPEGSVYRGREGLAEAIRVWAGTWTDWRWEIEELIDAGDRVLAVTRQSGRGKGSGVDVVQQTFGIFSLRDRQIVHVTILLDRAKALEAAGLRE